MYGSTCCGSRTYVLVLIRHCICFWEEYTPQRHGKKKPDLAKKKRMRVCTCILEICYNLVSLQSTVWVYYSLTSCAWWRHTLVGTGCTAHGNCTTLCMMTSLWYRSCIHRAVSPTLCFVIKLMNVSPFRNLVIYCVFVCKLAYVSPHTNFVCRCLASHVTLCVTSQVYIYYKSLTAHLVWLRPVLCSLWHVF